MTTKLEMKIIESKLSARCYLFEEDGERLVIFNGYIVDYATFCTMAIWLFSDSVIYKNLVNLRCTSKLAKINNITNSDVMYNLFNKFKTFLSPNNDIEKDKSSIKAMILDMYD